MSYFASAPTNILSMVVFAKHGLKERINLCLFFQSLADILFMTVNFLIYVDRIYLEVSGLARRGPIIQFILGNYLVGFYAFNSASRFMTMVIACERCFCVLSPLRSQTVLQTKTTLVILLLAFFTIVGTGFVIATRWGLNCVFNPRTNSTSFELYPSKFYRNNKKAVDTLDGYIYGIVLPGIFLLVVCITTIITVVKLKKVASWREQSSSAAMTVRDVTLTRMLIGCSFLFIGCTIPAVVFRTMIVVIPDISLRGPLPQHVHLHDQCHGAVRLHQLLLQLLHLLHHRQQVQGHGRLDVLQKAESQSEALWTQTLCTNLSPSVSCNDLSFAE